MHCFVLAVDTLPLITSVSSSLSSKVITWSLDLPCLIALGGVAMAPSVCQSLRHGKAPSLPKLNKDQRGRWILSASSHAAKVLGSAVMLASEMFPFDVRNLGFTTTNATDTCGSTESAWRWSTYANLDCRSRQTAQRSMKGPLICIAVAIEQMLCS